ncbi:MAG: glycosyltransferase, partial [Candidatus Promineifilaceae bacterium]|nr:glycosyltransferase [Candidatus Promineifilaceae bacterium]
MRILHLVHQYPPQYIGGTELYTQTLARHQAMSGHCVSIVSPAPLDNKQTVNENEELGVRIFRIPLKPRTRTQVFFQSFRQQRLNTSFQQILDQEKPEIVHIQHLMGIPMTVVDYLEDTRTPFVVTLHDYWYVCANAQLLTNTDQKICSGPNTRFTNCAACALARAGWSKWEWLAPALAPLLYYRDRRLHKILDLAQSIIVPTNFVYNTFAEMGAPVKKIRTIRHGLDLPRDSVHKVRKMRDMRGFRPPLHIGYIGGINWQKGIHVLIDAVNRLPVDQVKLTIYGNLSSFPDYVSELRRRCHHPNILLAGPVSREQIWTALASFDVLVLPTLWFETS